MGPLGTEKGLRPAILAEVESRLHLIPGFGIGLRLQDGVFPQQRNKTIKLNELDRIIELA